MRSVKRLTVAAAVVVCSLGSGSIAAAASQADRSARTEDAPMHSEAAAALTQDMWKLWTDHVVWTRDYIIVAATGKR
jgi:hypothetical protein